MIKRLLKFLTFIISDNTGSFNLGVGRNGIAPTFAMSSYLYNSAIYRKWIVDIALAFYTGRQDEFVYMDLQKQFRNPEKQQIVPYNLTKEIIDETSILYREEPTYTVKDKNGKTLKKDTDLWKQIRKEARYHNVCQQLDSMTKLLGTVLVKVSFLNPKTGDLVNANKPGIVQFELVYGGAYHANWQTSPYYLTDLTFNFTQDAMVQGPKYSGGIIKPSSGLSVASKPTDTTRISHHGGLDELNRVSEIRKLEGYHKIMWSLDGHEVHDTQGKYYTGANPYNCIPAVPFFNQDPGNFFYLPVNEPLIYANHAINMRLTDLNHVTKYQSFGQAVVKGIERPVNNRLGRPIDDYNSRGGSRSFGFGQGRDVGPLGLDRNFFKPFDYFQDGNAEANMNGYSLGPDTMVSVGEHGDFKYESPGADLGGLTRTIYTMMDMTRINHGLRPKHDQNQPGSAAAAAMEKLGVIEQNMKRKMLFKEREQQLFQIVKKMWNTHHKDSDKPLFDEDSCLEVYYVTPEFATDPVTKMNAVTQEQKIIATGDTQAIKRIRPELDDEGIKELLNTFHEDQKAQAERSIELEKLKIEAGIVPDPNAVPEGPGDPNASPEGKAKPNMPKAKTAQQHAEQSGIQPGKTGDVRKSNAVVRREEQAKIELEGGKSDKIQATNFDKAQLEMGIKIEMEHTKDKAIAEKIAKDHLVEAPDYYTHLTEMENKLKKKKNK